MKRIICIFIACVLFLSGCSTVLPDENESESRRETAESIEPSASVDAEWTIQPHSEEEVLQDLGTVELEGVNDPNLLQYVENRVYQDLVDVLPEEGYAIENVDAVYLSQEYIDELTYNSQSNVFFGYTLSELDELFESDRFVFTLEDGRTSVEEWTAYDDTINRIISNTAIGTGVIVVLITVSVVAPAVGAPAIITLMATSTASGATTLACSSGLISGCSTALITGLSTGDWHQALLDGALVGSEGFKIGAIVGATTSAASSLISSAWATAGGLSINEVAELQLNCEYPLDVLRGINNMDEAQLYINDGLEVWTINNRRVLVRPELRDYLDLFIESEGMTNAELMSMGRAPYLYNSLGELVRVDLHHVGQNANGTIAMLLNGAEHQGNASILNTGTPLTAAERTEFNNIIRPELWEAFSARLLNSAA